MTPRLAEIARLAVAVTLAPWDARRGPVLTDEDVVHVVALSAFFGHLNRIADAVAVPLDYPVAISPPPADPQVPALAPAPRALTPVPAAALELARRPATAAALQQWWAYVFDRDAPLARTDRVAVAAWVAGWLGDSTTDIPDGDPALQALARTVTLAPWQLTDASFAALRARGHDDAWLFDACVVASTAGVRSRIAVALAALG